MKTKLIITLALLTCVFTQAQTFTYTGTGNWTDQANWSPSYPGDNGLSNSNYIINIDGNCDFNNNLFSVLAQLNISGDIEFQVNNQIYISNNVFLDNGTFRVQNHIIFDNSTVFGFGELSGSTGFAELFDVIINPGDSSSGTISIQGFNFIDNGQFIFDIYSTTDFDTITNISVSSNSNVTNSVSINLVNSTTINSSSSFELFTNVNINFFNTLTNSILINGFQAQLTYSPTTGSTGNIIMTFADIEAPTITSCAVDQDVAAECGTFLTLPDYTNSVTATDNNAATTITYTQSPLSGTPIKDSAIVTLTATDGAGNSTECSFTINVTENTLTTTEVDDVVSRQLALYPNPSNGMFTLENTSGMTLEYAEVIDIKGVVIQTIDLSMEHFTKNINLNTLSSGLYLFKIYSVDGYALKKILIE